MEPAKEKTDKRIEDRKKGFLQGILTLCKFLI